MTTGPASLDELLVRTAAGETFDYLHFRGHREHADGGVSASCFSQWYSARFEIDGVSYASAEHFMMAEKARLFGDGETRAFLVGSAPRMLVEASPVDTAWGIGMAADDPRANDPRQWQGQNLLGFALMVVRDALAHA